MTLTSAEARAHADEVRATSVTLLRGLIPAATLEAWTAAFQPLLAAAVAAEGDDPNRGAHRYYVTLPFEPPWADPAIIDNDAIMAVVEDLVGADGVLCQLASDTPLRGSEHQELHRDTLPLFPETGAETPPYQLAVNFPLVDVTDETGPMEYAPGSHMLLREEAIRRVESGEMALTRCYMRRGDVMIRDVRHIHRGTPNLSATPRPMVVIGYSRRWLFRPEVSIRVPPRAGRGARRPARARPPLAALQPGLRFPGARRPEGRELPGVCVLTPSVLARRGRRRRRIFSFAWPSDRPGRPWASNARPRRRCWCGR
jgi:hypothetical protein